MNGRRNHHSKVDRRLRQILEGELAKAGMSSSISFDTVPNEGKNVYIRLETDFPPEIDDRVRYGEKPMLTVFGQSFEQEQQVVQGPSSHGLEDVRYDSERPEIVAYGAQVLHPAQQVLQEVGVEDITYQGIHLLRPLPPWHLSVMGTDDAGARRLTDEEIQDLLEDASIAEMIKENIREELEVLPYFRWKGGSRFADQCWELIRYSGIAVHAEGWIPADKIEGLLGNPFTG